MKPNQKRLSLRAFNAAVKTTATQARGREIAKAVLVDGRAQDDVAKEYSITQPAVSRYVSAVWEAHLGFVTVTGLIATQQLPTFEKWTRAARRELLLANHDMTKD